MLCQNPVTKHYNNEIFETFTTFGAPVSDVELISFGLGLKGRTPKAVSFPTNIAKSDK